MLKQILGFIYLLMVLTMSVSCSQRENSTDKEPDSNVLINPLPEIKHITIIVGTHHYSPHKSMPLLKTELEKFGFKVTLINPQWDPEKEIDKGLPGLEVLEETDLAIFFIRWLQLEGEQHQHLVDYIESGKPVVGFRTSGHGFNYSLDNPKSELNNGFGRDILGSPYLIHLVGNTKVSISQGQEKHPILNGVSGNWTAHGTLYLTNIQAGVTPLLEGTGSSKRTGIITNQFGSHNLTKTMTDHIAWTWTNIHGGKTFYTSLGHELDFGVEQSMRVMINGIHWALDAPIPSANTEIGTYKIIKPKKTKNKKKDVK